MDSNANNTPTANAVKKFNIEETAMSEYLDLVKFEYKIERDKRESLIKRAEFVIVLLGVLLIFMFNKVDFTDVFDKELSFTLLIKTILGLFSYGFAIISLLFSTLTISTRKQQNYPIKEIDDRYLIEERKNAIRRMFLQYKEVVIDHRGRNEKQGVRFKKSLLCFVVSVCSFFVYLLLK